uniref:Uncharacterized protein n=1 Tax=Anguilla anguilla TaxID=7936 RepID=A0A0E9SVP2_ANGAN
MGPCLLDDLEHVGLLAIFNIVLKLIPQPCCEHCYRGCLVIQFLRDSV